MDILYLDNRIVVCLKPAGVLSTDEPGGLPDLLRQELGGPETCLRTVHRLDRVVGGVMVLARSREAARRLSTQVQNRTFHKAYLAVVHGQLPDMGTFVDLLRRSKEERKTYLAEEPSRDTQEAILHFRRLGCADGLSLVHITLETGRTHQIRAQFSGHGFPLVGDRKYGAPEQDMEGIALWSCGLSFAHPQTGEEVSFAAPPPDIWPWSLFSKEINENLC